MFLNGELKIDPRSGVILDAYKTLDGLQSGMKSTGSGIAQAYGHRGFRDGIKARDLSDPARLEEKLVDLVPKLVHERLSIEAKKQGVPYLSKTDIENDPDLSIFIDLNTVEAIRDKLLVEGEMLSEYIDPRVIEDFQEAAVREMSILNETSNGICLDIHSGLEYGSSSIIDPAGIFVTQKIPTDHQKVHVVVKSFFSRVGHGYFVGEFGDRNEAMSKSDLLKSLGYKPNAKSSEYEEDAIRMMQSSDEEEVGDGLRLYYNEYGETTSRPRGKAPLDLVALRTAYNQIARGSENDVRLWINQVDGLEHWDEIPITEKYVAPDGTEFKTIPTLPDHQLRKLRPVTKHLPSWNEAMHVGIEAFPEKFDEYTRLIEEETGFEIGGIGTGPRTEDLIYFM